MPESLTIFIYVNKERDTESFSPEYNNQTFEIKINGEIVKTVTASDLQYNSETYRNFTYTINFLDYTNLSGKDYIKVELNEI